MKFTSKQLSEAMRQLGQKGGLARKAALTPERRRAIAIHAQQSRTYTKSKIGNSL